MHYYYLNEELGVPPAVMKKPGAVEVAFRRTGYFFIILDVIWLLMWFGISMALVEEIYIVQHSILLFHLTTLLTIIYVLDTNTVSLFSMNKFSPLALLVPLLTDTSELVHVIVHGTHTATVMYILKLALIIFAVFISFMSFVWYASFVLLPEWWKMCVGSRRRKKQSLLDDQ